MAQEGAKLLATAERYRQDRPQRHAVILNLSGLLHIEEPVFRRTLRRWLVGDGKPDAGGAVVDLFDLAHAQLVLIIPDALLADRRQALARVAEALASHHRGSMEAEWYDLARQGELFALAARRLVERAGQEQYPDAPPAADAMDRFMEIERTLHAVDLSSLMREQMIFRLDGESDLMPVMMERTIAIDALDRLFATQMRREPWLFDQVTSLLDRRMLYDLLRDDAIHSLPVAVKLHAGTVAGAEFRDMTARFPARLHGKLVVELPYLEWVADHELFAKAIDQARADEIAIAIDHVPAQAPSDTELPRVDWYRVPWLGDDGAPVDLSGGIAWLGPVARSHCILSRCRDEQALTDARTLGFGYVQGPAALRAYRDGQTIGEERRRDAAPRTAPGNSVEGEAPTEAPAPSGLTGWLTGLFGGKSAK